MQPTDRASLQDAVDSGVPFQSPARLIELDRSIVVTKPAWIPPMQVRTLGPDPAFDLRCSRVTMTRVDIFCDGRGTHGIVNRSGWDNEITYLKDVCIRNATSHAILSEDGDCFFVENFHPMFCGGYGIYSQNNLMNSRLHFAMTAETAGVYMTKRTQQPEGVDIGGKIVPLGQSRSGVVLEWGLKITIMPDAIIDQCGGYGLMCGAGVSDVTVSPGAWIGGHLTDGNPNMPLITLLNGCNRIRIDGASIVAGRSDQLIAFPGVRLLTIKDTDFLDVAAGRSNCNITGLQHSSLIGNRFWHARSGGGSLVWSGGDGSCSAYDNTSFHGNDPSHGGAWGHGMIITGQTRVRDNVEVTLPNGWTH